MNLIHLIIAAVLVNNLVLTNFVGINPAVASSKSNESAINMGLAIMLMLTISNVITKLVNDYILIPLGAQYLQTLAFVVVIVIVIGICYMLFKNSFKEKFESLEVFMPLIVINNLFLGVSILTTQQGLSLVETVVYSIGVGLGFTLVSVLLASINHKYRFADLPRHFLEKPITLMALGLMALAFYGFVGLV